MSSESSTLRKIKKLPPRIGWLAFRAYIVTHPRALTRDIVWTGTPWYATAYPTGIFQHWTPGIFAPVTFCGRVVEDTSTSEIRTLIGHHCRRCHRRATASRQRVLAERSSTDVQ
jgi:hypothetical protein